MSQDDNASLTQHALLVAWGLGRELENPRRRGWGSILLVTVLGLFALGLGLAAAVGFRVFVPFLLVSIAANTGRVQLAGGFEWLGTDIALVMFGIAALLEVAEDGLADVEEVAPLLLERRPRFFVGFPDWHARDLARLLESAPGELAPTPRASFPERPLLRNVTVGGDQMFAIELGWRE